MWRFLLKTLIWTIPGTIACYGIWIGLLYQNPSRDTLGLYRVMPVQCNSMIFGTSRSAQGINPAVLEQYAPHTGKWFNFSFNLAASPWNEAYADAVIEKTSCSIRPEVPSTFLLFVDPWALDEINGQGGGSWFTEPWSNVCNTSILDYSLHKSNPLDVIGHGSGSDFLSVFISSVPRQIFTSNSRILSGMQSNGWLPNPGSPTSKQIQQSIDKHVHSYQKKKIGRTWPMKANVNSITRVIEHLQKTFRDSEIFLIRPPVSRKMLELEQDWFPNAKIFFEQFAETKGVQFIDSNDKWLGKSDMNFNDGHHMSVHGSKEFSQFLAYCLASK